MLLSDRALFFLFSQVVINPNYEVAESDYTNNVMKCRSRYDGQRIWTYNCQIGETLTLYAALCFLHWVQDLISYDGKSSPAGLKLNIEYVDLNTVSEIC